MDFKENLKVLKGNFSCSACFGYYMFLFIIFVCDKREV